MNRKTSVELTNMCMTYDGRGNVLVEEKLVHNIKGLIFPGGHVEPGEAFVWDSLANMNAVSQYAECIINN